MNLSILKATRDEEAYNAFMRAYGDMMGWMFSSVPDAERGGIQRPSNNDDWQHLEEVGIMYNTKTGEAFEETYDEDEDDYIQTPIDIPMPVGAGLEGKVFATPEHDYVVKIPMLNQNQHVRNMAEGMRPRMMRSPLEAWWSKVLSHQYPVNPYSLFTSRHPLSKDKFSLNLVSPYVDQYHSMYGGDYMNAIHEHLFALQDVAPMWEDLQYELGDEKHTPEQIRESAEDYVLYEDPWDALGGNMYGNVVLDYLSDTPFIEDEHGGLLRQEEIDKLLEAALYEQQRVPKRYRQFGGNIDSRIQTIIDELIESQKQGRLVGSSINFRDDRYDVIDSNFGRGQM